MDSYLVFIIRHMLRAECEGRICGTVGVDADESALAARFQD